MFSTLLESRAEVSRNTAGTAVSAAIHIVLIAAAAMATVATSDAHPSAPKRDKVIYFAPPQHPQPQQVHPQRQKYDVLRTDATGFHPPLTHEINVPILGEGPRVEFNVATTGVDDHLPMHGEGIGSTPIGAGGPGGLDGGVVDANYVERIPALERGTEPPRYPQALRASGVTGTVVARFVVDTLGRAEHESITIVESSHPLFGDAVRQALQRYRFTPGMVSGRKVRTMVQLPFTFALH